MVASFRKRKGCAASGWLDLLIFGALRDCDEQSWLGLTVYAVPQSRVTRYAERMGAPTRRHFSRDSGPGLAIHASWSGAHDRREDSVDAASNVVSNVTANNWSAKGPHVDACSISAVAAMPIFGLPLADSEALLNELWSSARYPSLLRSVETKGVAIKRSSNTQTYGAGNVEGGRDSQKGIWSSIASR